MANMCLKLNLSHSPPSLQTLASSISTPSTKRRRLTHLRCVHRSEIFGTKLNRSESTRQHQPVKRDVTARLELDPEFSDEELALRYDDVLDWKGDMIPASIERKVNSVDLPFSLRIIKRKKQWNEGIVGIMETGESAYCSVKKAFSSMVFIIRELQSFTIHIRELLYYEDLHEILIRVQNEMNASFVWLFRQVFSQTPTLMVYVMILLANYSVHSMSHNFATAAPSPPAAVESISDHRSYTDTHRKFDSSTIKTFSASSSGRTTSIGGNNGGGGKFPAVASGTDGDGRLDSSSEIVSPARTGEEVWNSIVDEADGMQGVIDSEMMSGFVAPVTARLVEEDGEDYLRTEVMYKTGLDREPDNPLLLANYAQFLYLVARDYDRAEDYFKRASKVEPKDAEALNKYASFLWLVRKDLWAAEETYLEAISADPNNSFYAANYAHFLWNTGGEDTCFPLDSPGNMFSADV